MNPKFKGKAQLAEHIQAQTFAMHASCKINDDRRVIGMNDPLNIEPVDDNLKQFDEA